MDTCDRCREALPANHAHRHDTQSLCEACYMEVRTSKARKTHWQYLSSLKTEYGDSPKKTNR